MSVCEEQALGREISAHGNQAVFVGAARIGERERRSRAEQYGTKRHLSGWQF